MPINPQQNGFATEQALESRYVWDMGVIGIPVGGPPGTPMAVTCLHAPVCYRRVSWSVTSVGDRPLLPDPTPASTNEILVSKELAPQIPGKYPDQAGVYSISGIYLYLCLVPPSLKDSLPMGSSAVDAHTAEQNRITASDFTTATLGRPADIKTAITQGEFIIPKTLKLNKLELIID